MTTFAKNGFSAAGYLSYRPTYNANLYQRIYDFHQGGNDLAIDVGCGPGTVTTELAKKFSNVVGLDPSKGMVETARKALEQSPHKDSIRYEVSNAETLPSFIKDSSVDLVTSGQAAHWFDMKAFWKEAARITKPGGTFAIWTYGLMKMPDQPELSAIMDDLAYSDDKFGPYWEKGRAICDGLYTSIAVDHDNFTNVERVFFPEYFNKTDRFYRPVEDTVIDTSKEKIIETRDTKAMQVKWQVPEQLLAYTTTWSSGNNYTEAHGGDNSLATNMINGWVEKQGVDKVDVDIYWPTSLILARRR